jgi:hypothetical protein
MNEYAVVVSKSRIRNEKAVLAYGVELFSNA